MPMRLKQYNDNSTKTLSPFQLGIYRKSIINPSRRRFRTRAPPPGRSASMTAAGGRAART